MRSDHVHEIPAHPCPSASAGAATAELSRRAGGNTIRGELPGHSYNRTTAIHWLWPAKEINCAKARSGTKPLRERFSRQALLCRCAGSSVGPVKLRGQHS